MEKITIYKFESTDIKILMKVYFNEENKLIFDGYDTGRSVKKLMKSSSYEYKYSIEFSETKKLAKIFNINFNEKMVILNEIKNRFNENNAYSKFGKFMKENNIKFESFTWR
ncbi:hypothetical protein [uncultured Polaribacter sp.]|uniref:hypothetical protein n=1 Tax=uncultured Polaribacter sp. TaxID=174711 RepID=UPI00263578E0|nr:hypothetical protein [uncultured Polaribacter sp.]